MPWTRLSAVWQRTSTYSGRGIASECRTPVLTGQAFPVDDRALQAAEGLQGVIGDDAGTGVAQLLVEDARTVIRAGIEREQRSAAVVSDALSFDHQRAPDASPALAH